MFKNKFELTTTFTTKAFDEENEELIITGIANSTNKDRDGDVIVEEAWGGDALKG